MLDFHFNNVAGAKPTVLFNRNLGWLFKDSFCGEIVQVKLTRCLKLVRIML